MKNRFIWILLVFPIFGGCVKVDSLDGVVINAIRLSDVNLTEQDAFNDKILNWVYFGNKLYISDNLHKKIFVLEPSNRISFELGNIFDTSTKRQNQQEGWEDIIQKMQEDFSAGKPSSNTQLPVQQRNSSPSQVVRVNFKFHDIGKIAVDHSGNLYIVHTFRTEDTAEKKMEILKFSASGKFLYKIGAEGRDNPPFRSNYLIQSLMADSNNGLWVKYTLGGKLFLRYYSSFGKNILFFSEERLVPLIEGYLKQNFEGQKYIIEDIFPLMSSQDIMIVVDIYKEDKSKGLQIEKKEILVIDKRYNLRDIFNIPGVNTQIYGITADNKLYGFRYEDKDAYLLEVYDVKGNIMQKSRFSPDVSYYKRISLGMNMEEGLLGVFIKSKDLVFILWK